VKSAAETRCPIARVDCTPLCRKGRWAAHNGRMRIRVVAGHASTWSAYVYEDSRCGVCSRSWIQPSSRARFRSGA
jgi:hypothetical protein